MKSVSTFIQCFVLGTIMLQTVPIEAQTFTTLYNFTDNGYDPTGAEAPNAGMILSGNSLYATASGGGYSGNGTIFKIDLDGSGFTNIYEFTGAIDNINADGVRPGTLVLSSNTLYGVAFSAGAYGKGTIFSVNRDGSHFSVLHQFIGGNDGAYPNLLVLSTNTLYGGSSEAATITPGCCFELTPMELILRTYIHSRHFPIGSQTSMEEPQHLYLCPVTNFTELLL